MNDNTPSKRSDIIDISGLLKFYWSKWYYFVISVGLCGFLALCYVMIKDPVYQVNAHLLISQEGDGGAGNMLSDVTFGLFGGDGYVEDEVFVVSSHSVLKDVVKELELHKSHIVNTRLVKETFKYKKFPVEIFCDPSIADTLSKSLKFKVRVDDDGSVEVTAKQSWHTVGEAQSEHFPITVSTPYGQFSFNKTEHFIEGEDLSTDIYFMSYDSAAEGLSEEVSISIASKKSNVIALGMPHPDAQYAKDVLNTIVEKYNERGIEEKNLKGEKTAAFIDSRLELLAQDLSSSETNIEAYKKQQGIVDIAAEATYQMNKKSNLEKQLIQAETEFEILKITREFIANPANDYSLIPTTSGSANVQNAINAYNGLILERVKLQKNAKANNAMLKALDEQIEVMRKNINVSLDKAYDNSLVALKELRAEVNSADSRLGNIPTQEREFLNIKRQQTIKETLYLFLLQRREETAMMLANAVAKGIIVDEAFTLKDPVSLSNKMIILIAILFGCCIPPVWFYLKKLMRTQFETKEEIEAYTNVPVIGEMCVDKSNDSLVIKSGGSTTAAELFRLIRTNLKFILSGKNDKVVLVTSTVSGEGKSFISINLAASLAMLGEKVLLVGMDIRSPKLAEYLNLQTRRGLTEYLSTESISLNDIINVSPLQNNMDIIVAGPVPPNPAELLASTRVDDLFEQLRGMYDYIIVDSAPVGMVSDTFTLTRISDATVYVCRANYTSIKDFNFINSLYDTTRLKRMSLVVNGTNCKKGYGYGYGSTQQKS